MVLRSPLLNKLGWVEHGFGTRDAPRHQDGMASLKQIHSNLSLIAQSPGNIGEADALVTDRPGLAVSVRTADCFPILLADAGTKAVAAVHAGWRGTADEILIRTLDRMRTEYGTNTSDVWVAIGPGIGKCCYEVGIEVAQRFGEDHQTHLDLAVQNRDQLLRAGIRADRVDMLALCTFCNPGKFFSWRRDHENGRMISYIRQVETHPDTI